MYFQFIFQMLTVQVDLVIFRAICNSKSVWYTKLKLCWDILYTVGFVDYKYLERWNLKNMWLCLAFADLVQSYVISWIKWSGGRYQRSIVAYCWSHREATSSVMSSCSNVKYLELHFSLSGPCFDLSTTTLPAINTYTFIQYSHLNRETYKRT